MVFCYMILFIFVTADVVIPVTQGECPAVTETAPGGFLGRVTAPRPGVLCLQQQWLAGTLDFAREMLSPTTNQVIPEKGDQKRQSQTTTSVTWKIGLEQLKSLPGSMYDERPELENLHRQSDRFLVSRWGEGSAAILCGKLGFSNPASNAPMPNSQELFRQVPVSSGEP